jgi:hypothetical protein
MLAGENVELNPNPEDAIPGFYRTRRGKAASFEPVSIFLHEGTPFALRSGEAVKVESVWPGCALNPIKYEEYERVAEKGLAWSDADETVEQLAQMGDNSNAFAALDPAEVYDKEIEIAEQGVAKYPEIVNDEMQARAQALRSKLLELSTGADKERETRKRPLLEEGKKVDGKWMPLVKRAKAAADRLREVMSAWETKKFRAEQEAERKRAAQIAAAQQMGLEVDPPPATPLRNGGPIKGASGRAASVRVVKVAVIVDQQAVYDFFKGRPEVLKLLTELAQRAVDLGNDVPGIEINNERRVA